MKRIFALLMSIICVFSLISIGSVAVAATTAPANVKSVKTTVTATTASATWSAVKNAKGYRFYTWNESKSKWVTSVSQTDQLGVEISNLSPGRKYTFAIKSFTEDSNGKTVWAKGYTDFSILTRPSEVKTIKTSSSETEIKLTWSKAEGAKGYRVYRYISSSKSWKALKTTSARSYTVTGLSAGKKYIFAVKPYAKQDGITSWASKITKVSVPTAPKATTKITSSVTTNSVTLKWGASPGATGYRIYIRNTAKNQWDVASSKVGSTSVTIGKLSAGKKYTFAVRPYTTYGGITAWGKLTQINVTTAKAQSTTTVTTTESTSRTIYRTKTGKKYHYVNPCGNGTYYATTLAEAQKANLKPCEKCVLS